MKPALNTCFIGLFLTMAVAGCNKQVHSSSNNLFLTMAVAGCNKQVHSSSNNTVAAPATAIESSHACLALLDSGSYSKAWEGTAASMRSTMSQADFEKGMQTIRAPLGRAMSRNLKYQRHKDRLPGLPDGDYWLIGYMTDFENKPGVAETVVLALERDGNWRVAGYSLP